MVKGSISTGDLPSHVLDGLFDSVGKETISDDVYIQNYCSVGKLINETDHDSGIIFYQYSDARDDTNSSIKLEENVAYQIVNVIHFILLTFQKYITSLFIKGTFGPQIMT